MDMSLMLVFMLGLFVGQMSMIHSRVIVIVTVDGHEVLDLPASPAVTVMGQVNYCRVIMSLEASWEHFGLLPALAFMGLATG